MKKIKVVSCLITIAIMTLIFFFSSQDSKESSMTSGRLIRWFIDIMPAFSSISETDKLQLVMRLSFIVRKTAHFTIYAMLGLSSAISFRLITGRRYKAVLWISTVFCMLYAVSDEFHQWFVSGRAGRVGDVCIDTVGAIAGSGLLILVVSLKRFFLQRREHRI